MAMNQNMDHKVKSPMNGLARNAFFFFMLNEPKYKQLGVDYSTTPNCTVLVFLPEWAGIDKVVTKTSPADNN